MPWEQAPERWLRVADIIFTMTGVCLNIWPVPGFLEISTCGFNISFNMFRIYTILEEYHNNPNK